MLGLTGFMIRFKVAGLILTRTFSGNAQMRRTFEQLGPNIPFGMILAGLLFGIGFRAGTARALDGGEGRCDRKVFGEFVEVRRLTGDQALETQDFWRPHAVLTVMTPDSIIPLAIYDEDADDGFQYYLAAEATP